MPLPSLLPALEWDESRGELLLLDQTLLPGEERILRLSQPEEIYQAIAALQVRGAPAIGVAAAFGLYLAARSIAAANKEEFLRKLEAAGAYLATARPTAVNLTWALSRLIQAAADSPLQEPEELKALLLGEAQALRAEDIEICRAIGIQGLSLLRPNMGILTHCNAGRLATIGYGTALAPIYLGQEQGYAFRVYADETRPLLQGARLTAYELQAAGVNTTLICDSMAAVVMAQGKVDAILVGCDRVAVNGDAANKIGTLGLAVLAAYYKIPFYMAAPLSTVDLSCPSGGDIPIEEREGEEIRSHWYQKPMAPQGIAIYNPAFDITPRHLIDAFITEKGIAYPPYTESLAQLMADKG